MNQILVLNNPEGVDVPLNKPNHYLLLLVFLMINVYDYS